MTLAKFQREFARAIREPTRSVAANLGIAQADTWRFNVYRNNYFHGLIGTLSDAYPLVAHLLGQAAFASLTHRFLREHPIREVSLAVAGDGFVDFVAQVSFATHEALIRDAARLDRACLQSLHAPDQPLLPAAALQQLGEALASARFEAHAATRLIASTQALVTNWRSRTADTGALDGPAEGALVTRVAGRIQVLALNPAATEFGRLVLNSTPVMDSYEKAQAMDEHFDLTRCFGDFLAAGAFCGVQTDD